MKKKVICTPAHHEKAKYVGKLQLQHVKMSSNIPKLLLLTVKFSGVFFPRDVNASEAPLASPQSSLPHRSLLAPQPG